MSIQALRERRAALVDQVKNLLDNNTGARWTNAVSQRVDALYSKIGEVDLELRDYQRDLDSAGGGFLGGAIGASVSAELEKNRETLEKTGNVRFTIKAAASDPATTATTRSVASAGVGFPSGAAIGLQAAFKQRNMQGVSAIEYSRYSSTEGSAAVQAAEGDTKAYVAPRFTLVSQKAITIAGITKASTQALADQEGAKQAIDATLGRQIALATDDMLTAGSGALFGGMETLATAYTSLVYQGFPDSISEGVATMQGAGFNPDVVVLNPADWLTTQVARTATEKLYLSGSYLGPLPESMRGLRVVVSPGLTAGASLLLDSSQCELIIVDGLQVAVGYINDDFAKNLLAIRAEIRIAPIFRAVGAARLITPKA